MSSPACCRNCQAPLHGEYCSRCGQRAGREALSFRQLAGELAEDVFDWDSRFWRTLVPLVFRPGFLTAEFIAGRRARYVPPLRLYLIISFIMFLVFSLLTSDSIVLQADAGGGATIAVNADAPAAAPGSAGSRSGEEARFGADLQLADEDSPRWLQDLDARIEMNANRFTQNPDTFLQLLQDYLPQMMFLLLPVVALLLKLCYLFSPYHYLQHLVFSLHYHSFGYLLYLLGALVSQFLYENGIGDWLILAFAAYLPLALMRVYGSGVAGAIGKSVFILVSDAILLLFAFVLIVLVILAQA